MECAETIIDHPPVPDEPAPPVVLLCGGVDDYIGESGTATLRPLLSVAGRPLLVRIMRQFADHGSTEFVLALAGPAQQQMKDYFLRLELHSATVIIRLGSDPVVRVLDDLPEKGWTITCADTGGIPGSGTRLRYAASFVPRWPVIVAYGKGLADVNVADLVRFHRAHGRLATVAVAIPPARPGHVTLAGDHRVLGFGEQQPHTAPGLVSVGSFMLEQAAVERYIPPGTDVMLEGGPIRDMIADGELMAYRHHGYWQPVDTWEDLAAVRRSWESGIRPGLVLPAPRRTSVPVVNGTRAHHNGNGRLSALTNRELQVANLVSDGLTNRVISRRLSVAEKTVEMHLSNIFAKLVVSSRTELAACVIRAEQA
jgi:glucose-1-phosphate cytidylyltransferase